MSAGSGAAGVAASVPLTGLSSSTTYHARLVATSAGGTTNGPDLTFTTGTAPQPVAPGISGSAAGSITAAGATISADITPNGSATTYTVEYGTTPSYGAATTAASAGSGSSAVGVSTPVTGLASSTQYHARVVATSVGGTTNGPDLTFTTAAAPTPPGTGGGAPPGTAGGAPPQPLAPPAAGPPEAGPPAPGALPAATAPPGDRSAPGLAAAFTRRAIRRGGRARLRVLVSENATIGLRMLDRRSRVVLTLSGRRVAAGRRAVLKVSTRARSRALRRGSYRVVVTAKDAAGNATTRTVRLRLR